MKRSLFILFHLFVFTFFSPQVVFSRNNYFSFSTTSNQSAAFSSREMRLTLKKKGSKDIRVEKLKEFLQEHNSSLSIYAEYLINISDKYNIPWSLLPAIAGAESTFCKNIRKNSFNCWGWNNGKTRFQSQKNTIDIVAKTIKEKYFDVGLTTPGLIGPIYAPPTKSWPAKVKYFMHQIENYIPQSNTLTLQITL